MRIEDIKKENLVDMVIAFDTTGSMMSYINNVKEHVTKLIPTLFEDNPNIKVGIVAFGDYCDKKSTLEYDVAYQCLDLTNDINKLLYFVENAENTGGGDSEEFYELVIKKIIKETSWRENSTKSVLLIADSTPHEVGYKHPKINNKNHTNIIDWRKEANKAKKAGIQFDTLTICNKVKWYKELSQITGGVCLPFKDSKNTSQLIRATALSRGGEATKIAFYEVMEDSKDNKEIYDVYSTYSKEIVK